MSRLSQIEKYIIQGMLHSGKTREEICELTSRTPKCIDNYIDGELDKIHSTIAKIEMAKTEIVEPEAIVPSVPPKPDLAKVVTLPKGQAKRTMLRQTMGGKEGVSIMTPAASAVGDDFAKQAGRTMSRTAKGHIYDADGNKKE